MRGHNARVDAVQVVVNERTGLDFFFPVVCRQAGWTCTRTSQV
eukprot:SAG11_NODE_41348_length_195_cov_16.552083_1_plen_42_part_10